MENRFCDATLFQNFKQANVISSQFYTRMKLPRCFPPSGPSSRVFSLHSLAIYIKTLATNKEANRGTLTIRPCKQRGNKDHIASVLAKLDMEVRNGKCGKYDLRFYLSLINKTIGEKKSMIPPFCFMTNKTSRTTLISLRTV